MEALQKLQAMPLNQKISRTLTKINEWYIKNDNQVYVSFSGGKDSCVLAELAARYCFVINITLILCFIDTGLEYPELRTFVKFYVEHLKEKYKGLEIDLRTLTPKMKFNEVIKTYGYPVPSKEVAKNIEYGRKALKRGDMKKYNTYINGVRLNKKTGLKYIYMPLAKKWMKLFESDIPVSNYCCNIMKKTPAKEFEKETGLRPMVGEMADDSKEREMNYLRSGCNAFDGKRLMSKPMGFWLEQDVLQYIKNYNIPICSVYGDIIEEVGGALRTAGVNRTGCIFCMFGCHLQKEPNKFQQLQATHPKQWDYCIRPVEEKGLGLGKVLDFIGVPYMNKKIYYAHHIWKYNTPIEEYELNLIKEKFPDYEIINPNECVNQNQDTDKIMNDCLDLIKDCGAIVFSSLSGTVGKGVVEEVEFAKSLNKLVFYIRDNEIVPYSIVEFEIIENSDSNRIYANIV